MFSSMVASMIPHSFKIRKSQYGLFLIIATEGLKLFNTSDRLFMEGLWLSKETKQ